VGIKRPHSNQECGDGVRIKDGSKITQLSKNSHHANFLPEKSILAKTSIESLFLCLFSVQRTNDTGYYLWERRLTTQHLGTCNKIRYQSNWDNREHENRNYVAVSQGLSANLPCKLVQI
jgi:hypothetical protein